MSTTVMKQGDTFPPLVLTCLDGGDPVDLSAATSVRVRVAASTSAEPIVDALATKANQVTAKGQIEYAWQDGETDTAGVYLVEVIVTWPSGQQTFPAKGYGRLTITDDLAAGA